MTFDDREQAAHAAERERRLEAEHELDDEALRESLPPAESADGPARDGVAPVGPTPEPATTVPPPRTGMPRRTRILIGLVLAALVFLAGVQFQKLAGGLGGARESAQPGTAGTPGTPGASTTPAPLPPAVTYGEIVAIRGTTLYVRDADGQTFTVLASPGSRIVRGQPIALREIRPGETIVARARRDSDGRLAATTITVVEPAGR